MIEPEPQIAVLLVDDHDLVRSGLHRILRRRDGFVIAGECADGDEVPAAVARCRPDVVLMELRMKRVGGIEATRALCGPGALRVLILTTFDDDELLSGALHAGASGFILKDSTAEELVKAVRAVAAGDGYLDPTVTARVLNTYLSYAAALGLAVLVWQGCFGVDIYWAVPPLAFVAFVAGGSDYNGMFMSHACSRRCGRRQNRNPAGLQRGRQRGINNRGHLRPDHAGDAGRSDPQHRPSRLHHRPWPAARYLPRPCRDSPGCRRASRRTQIGGRHTEPLAVTSADGVGTVTL